MLRRAREQGKDYGWPLRRTGEDMKGFKAARVALLAVVVVCAGCNGFPRSEPIRQAENKPEKYPTYTPAAPSADAPQPRPRTQPGEHH